MSLPLTATQTSSTLLRGGTIAALPFLDEILSLCYDLRWLMALCLALVVVDFKFGCENSIEHNIPIRWSNAWRRTVNKVADYFCWIVLGGLLGKACGEPYGIHVIYVAAAVILVASAIEIDSIIQNYYEARGVHGMTLKLIIGSWLKLKSPSAAETLKDDFKDVKKESSNKE